jgi:MYXO-CTERM domain-containing protein
VGLVRRPKLHSSVGLILCSLVTALFAGGCSGGCSSVFQPLPKPVPAAQTIEGGVQVRVTRNGLRTITNAAKEIIGNLTRQGICIPRPSDVDLGILGELRICARGDCAGGATGCRVNVSLGNVATSVVGAQVLRADVTFGGSATVPITYVPPIFDNITCNLGASMSNAHLVVDVRVGTSATTGELTVNLDAVRALDISPSINVCDLGLPSDVVTFIVDVLLDLLGTDFGLLIVNLITPTIDGFIQGLLPRPLGLEGLVDLGGLLSSIAPGIESKIEVRGVPGGYATLPADGVSVGVIVGMNADRDTATRTGPEASQPSLCVPQWSPPDLAAPPMSLSRAPGRQTFSLKPSGAYLGVPDPTQDVIIGVSQTLLDLAGHHVISSGALCLGIGSSFVPQLNLGTIGILVRSLAELGRTGKEPILLVMRPTKPMTFDIGTGTQTSPYITAHLRELEVDFYALVYERYVRGFTISVSVDVGINLEFMLDAQRRPVLVPTLVGLDTSQIQVKVSNTQLLRETPEQLEAVFPTLLNLFIPLLTEGLPDFPVPAIEGFTLADLRLGKVTTSEDDFLSIYASLMRAQGKPAEVARARTEARLARVSTPPPEQIVAFLTGQKGGALPEVEIDLGGVAPGGGDLEWQWNLNGGMWRPFSSERRLVIRDLALAVQGRHTIFVRGRAAGSYETTEERVVEIPVVIDSVAPSFAVGGVRRDGDEIVLKVSDLVTHERDLQLALGPEGAASPTTAWAATEGRLAAADLETVASASGRVTVFARDEVGNVAKMILDAGRVAGVHGQGQMASGDGCSCHVGDGPHDHGGWLTALLGALLPLSLLLRRRLRLALRWVAAGLLTLVAGCSSAKLASVECTRDSDCAQKCPAGQVGTCDASGMCKCLDDIPLGFIGAWSDVAVSSGGDAWISAYNSGHGDLMVARHMGTGRVADTAWEFADGVPPGPVVNAASTVRGGIREPGDDVGLYTSIAVTQAGDPVVAHYDRTNQSLRLSARRGGVWTSSTVDAGAPDGDDVGRYASLTLDAMGRPGIAYLAIVKDGRGSRSEVRFAQAKTATPAAASDWTQVVVESRAVPPDPSGGMLDDIPFVNGVFVASARNAAGDPIVVYYDRINGDLRLAEANAGGATFKASVVVDGAQSDVGWYPSIAVGADGKAQITYVDATRDDLVAIVYPGGQREIIDDGLRSDGMTADGMARPVFHLIGDGSTVLAGETTRAVYQDATTHELVLATKSGRTWTRAKVAGADTPFKGSYGFFAAAARTAGGETVMTSFVLNQAMRQQWVEVFRQR